MVLGLAGKSGTVPNPLEDGVVADDPNHKLKYIIEEGAPRRLYTVPNVEHGTDENGNPIISIRLDKTDEDKLPEILETLKTRLSKGGKQIEFKTRDAHNVRIEQPLVRQTFKFETLGWQRGIIKIAYELAFRFLGPSYLDDPIAQNLREILLPDEITDDIFAKHPVRGTIQLTDNMQDFAFLDDPDSLYGALLHINGMLICAVKILGVFQGKIVVTENFQGGAPLEGDVIRIDVAKKETLQMPYYEYLSRLFPEESPNGT